MSFRSSWEVLFYIMNFGYEYEKLRIPYLHKENKRIYLVDFINRKERIAVEIKPKSKSENSINSSKMKYLKQWCIENDYKMKLVSEDDLKKYEYSEFLEKLDYYGYKIEYQILNKIQKLIKK